VTRVTRNQTEEYEFTFANVCAQVAREINCLHGLESAFKVL
jgi:hypothetical protein